MSDERHNGRYHSDSSGLFKACTLPSNSTPFLFLPHKEVGRVAGGERDREEGVKCPTAGLAFYNAGQPHGTAARSDEREGDTGGHVAGDRA